MVFVDVTVRLRRLRSLLCTRRHCACDAHEFPLSNYDLVDVHLCLGDITVSSVMLGHECTIEVTRKPRIFSCQTVPVKPGIRSNF